MGLPYNLNRFGGGKKRPYYCEVEWIQTPVTSTNVSYFLTNMKPSVGTSITMLVMPTSIGTRWITGGSGTQSGGAGATFVEVNANGYWGCGTQGSIAASNTTVQKVKVKFNLNSHELYVDDTLALTYTLNIPHTTDPYYWGLGAMTSSTGYRMPAKWYRAYQEDSNGNIIHDLIPVLDWDMTPCLYDKITNTFIYKTQIVSSGTVPQLSYGREIHYVEYLHKTNDQRLETGIFFTTIKDIEVDMDVLLPSSDTDPRWLFVGDYGVGGNTTSLEFIKQDKKLRLFLNNGASNTYSTIMTDYMDRKIHYKFLHNASDNFYSSTLGNTSVTVTYTQGYSNPSASLCLFGDYRTNNGASVFGEMDMYNCTMKVDGVLVRDYKPAIDQYGVGFMFDAVTHTIFETVSGTEKFSYPDVKCEKIITDGTAYLNTDIIFNGNETFKIVGLRAGTAGRTMFGGRVAGQVYNGLYEYSRGIWACNNNSTVHEDIVWTMDLEHDLTYTGATLTLDGTNYTLQTVVNTVNYMSLFALNNGGSATAIASDGSYIKLVEYYNTSNELVRNYVPICHNGEVCMKDTVTNAYITNAASSGTFRAKIKEKR